MMKKIEIAPVRLHNQITLTVKRWGLITLNKLAVDDAPESVCPIGKPTHKKKCEHCPCVEEHPASHYMTKSHHHNKWKICAYEPADVDKLSLEENNEHNINEVPFWRALKCHPVHAMHNKWVAVAGEKVVWFVGEELNCLVQCIIPWHRCPSFHVTWCILATVNWRMTWETALQKNHPNQPSSNTHKAGSISQSLHRYRRKIKTHYVCLLDCLL